MTVYRFYYITYELALRAQSLKEDDAGGVIFLFNVL